MKHKTRSKGKLRTPKTILRLRTSRSQSPPSSTVFLVPTLSGVTGMRSTNSWIGIARSRGCRSARPWLSGTGCIWSLATSPQAPSIFDSEQSGVSHTKLRIAGCSAQTWQPEYGELKALRSSE